MGPELGQIGRAPAGGHDHRDARPRRARRRPLRSRPPGPRTGAWPRPPPPRPDRRCSHRGCSARGPARPAAGCPISVRRPKSPVVSHPSAARTVRRGLGVDQLGDRTSPSRPLAPVAPHDGVGTQQHPPDLAVGHGTSLVVDDGQLHPGHGAAHRGGHLLVASTRGSSPSRARPRSRCSGRPRARPAGWRISAIMAAVVRAAPVPAMRSELRSARSSSALPQHQRPLGGHALGHGDALVGHDPHGVVGPPGRGGDHGRDGVGHLVPRPRHVADVGEGQGRETAVAGLAEHVGAPGHRGQVGVVEDRPLGPSGRAAGPDHGDGIVRRQLGPGVRRRAVPRRRGLGPAERRAPRCRRGATPPRGRRRRGPGRPARRWRPPPPRPSGD